MKQIQTYTYVVPANGSVQVPATNDNFIVLAASGPVTVRGDTFGSLPNLSAGQGLKAVPFNRLELKDESGAPNTVTLLMSPAEFVNQVFSGSVSIVGGVLTDAQLRAAPVPVRTAELNTNHWNSNATMVAVTPLTIFNAAANPNGAIILQMESVDLSASNYLPQSFIAKATAPTTTIDGEVLAQSIVEAVGTSIFSCIRREQPVRLAPGLGLYFISAANGTAAMLRNARYILL